VVLFIFSNDEDSIASPDFQDEISEVPSLPPPVIDEPVPLPQPEEEPERAQTKRRRRKTIAAEPEQPTRRSERLRRTSMREPSLSAVSSSYEQEQVEIVDEAPELPSTCSINVVLNCSAGDTSRFRSKSS